MRGAWLVAIAALAAAYAWPIQGGGGVQNAHYVLTKALVAGTAEIEGVLGELGDFATEDYAVYQGRRYANKAPGFAALAVPPYLLLRAAAVRTTGDPARMLWALGLFVVVVPALCLLALVRDRADAVAAGFGTATAVTLGAGTLLLPYATVFLPHVLAAALLFGAFALLWRARASAKPWLPVFAAGVLSGYGVATEYPTAIGAVILLCYALLGGGRDLARGVTFAAGGVVGVLPLLIYNEWAFGDVFHNSYSGVANAGLDTQFGAPSARVALQLLLSANGLLVLTPILVCAAAGIALLLRQGSRAEAAVVAAVAVGYVVFNTMYFSPFGGSTWPGTRYSLTILPFLAVPLAPVFRARPVTCGAMTVVSIIVMVLVTSTHGLVAGDGRWLERLANRQLTPAVPSVFGITGWYGILPFVLAVAIAAAAALLSLPAVAARAGDVLLAAASVAAWAVVATSAPRGADAASYRSYGVAVLVLSGFLAFHVARRAYAVRVNDERPVGESS